MECIIREARGVITRNMVIAKSTSVPATANFIHGYVSNEETVDLVTGQMKEESWICLDFLRRRKTAQLEDCEVLLSQASCLNKLNRHIDFETLDGSSNDDKEHYNDDHPRRPLPLNPLTILPGDTPDNENCQESTKKKSQAISDVIDTSPKAIIV